KRFNAAWAGVKAWQAVTMASLGVEGPYHAMVGKRAGLLNALGFGPAEVQDLLGCLENFAQWPAPVVSLKQWPLGARGQAAIQATLEATAVKAEEGRTATRVDVLVPQGVYDHMVRFDGYQPVSMD